MNNHIQLTHGNRQIIKAGGFIGEHVQTGFVYTVYQVKPFKPILKTTDRDLAISTIKEGYKNDRYR